MFPDRASTRRKICHGPDLPGAVYAALDRLETKGYPTGIFPWNRRLQIALLFPNLIKEQEMALIKKRL